MPLDNAVADREAESSAVSALGRKERLEDLFANVLRHACAVISEAEAQTISRARAANRKPTAPRHRIYRIDDEVDKNFAQLGSAAVSVQTRFRVKRHVVIEPAQARLVLPARSRDLDRVVQQATNFEQLKLFGRRLAGERLNAAHSGGGILGGSLNDPK